MSARKRRGIKRQRTAGGRPEAGRLVSYAGHRCSRRQPKRRSKPLPQARGQARERRRRARLWNSRELPPGPEGAMNAAAKGEAGKGVRGMKPRVQDSPQRPHPARERQLRSALLAAF
jgi:hypothetical protein